MTSIKELKRKFKNKKEIEGKVFDQIEHTSSIMKAKQIKKKAKNEGYYARLLHHPLKKDRHYDVYVRKKISKVDYTPIDYKSYESSTRKVRSFNGKDYMKMEDRFNTKGGVIKEQKVFQKYGYGAIIDKDKLGYFVWQSIDQLKKAKKK